MKKVDVLLGLQWGDEGKGKIVDVVTPGYNIIARFQGGPNAGHTLEIDGRKHVLHTIPSGIFRENVINVVGNGVVIDPVILKKEIAALTERGVDATSRLKISKKAHLILPTHRLLDAASEASKGKSKIGSTLKGIGPTYMDKTGRNGLRIGDLLTENFRQKYDFLKSKHEQILSHYGADTVSKEVEDAWFESLDTIKQFELIDSEQMLNSNLDKDRSILAEGAQGSLLDIDFGSYPFVTSSNTVCAGACTGLGVAPNRIGRVIGIFKAYCTRVGSGPFPTELEGRTGELLGDIGREFGSTTGRRRRCGWLDLPALKYAIMINGVTELCMMKTDVLDSFDTIRICTAYKINGQLTEDMPYDLSDGVEAVYTDMPGWKTDLTALKLGSGIPDRLNEYIAFIEQQAGVPISIVSVGPDREQTIKRTVEADKNVVHNI